MVKQSVGAAKTGIFNQFRMACRLGLPIAALLAVAFLSSATGVSADNTSPEQVAATLREKALLSPGTMRILTSLTTDVGPRLAGSDAEKRAAAWAQRTFEQLGFDKVWTESFPIEHGWVRGIEKAEVVGTSAQPLVVAALGGSIATPPEGIEAEIAVFKTYEALLAAPVGSLKGKIAVVTQPMVRAQDGSGYGFAARIRSSGASEAARRGAVGYLLRSLGTDSHRIPHTGAMHYAADAPKIPAAALSVPDAEQLDRLVAEGGPVRVRLVLTPRDPGAVTSQNVIAEIKGSEKPEEIVLIGAHLDSWDLGTGAIDDGAGVAIAMSATKLIHDLPQRPKRTIRVVLYGSEEIGLVGGKAYAESHKAELNHYVVVAEPDLGQGPIYKFQTGVATPEEASLKIIRVALAPLGIVPGDNLSRGSSDVEPLAEAGVPAVTLEMDGSDYFDLHHTSDDTLDKVRPERINQTTAAYAVFLYLTAELDGDYRAKAPVAAK
ncbi:MAG: aminopeptidase precursor [Pedosphaera sp.]|nr:aminopeptidase precursor [Pedosphaera sp.]